MKTSQTNRILNHLKQGKKLTPLQALQKFDCFRLAARINEIRAAGKRIKTDTITRNGKKIAQYSLS
jgi:hypothetical protein